MTIKTLVQDAKAKGAYTQRRAVAVAEHGQAVIVAGVEAAKTVATVAAEQLKSAAQQHKATLTDSSLPVKARVQKLRSGAGESFATLKAELEANPDAPDAAHKRAEFEELLAARRTRQIASTKDRVEKNPTDLQLRFEYGAALLAGGQLSEAIAELQKAKNNPNIRNRSTLMLARCYEQKGIYDLALRQLNECAQELLGMDSTKKEVLYAKGLIHEKLGQKEAALEDFKQIYEVDYGYLDVAQRVESSYS